jgi:hypothetical protein
LEFRALAFKFDIRITRDGMIIDREQNIGPKNIGRWLAGPGVPTRRGRRLLTQRRCGFCSRMGRQDETMSVADVF